MSTANHSELAVLDQVSHMLINAETLNEIKLVRDKADAVCAYARAANLGLQVQNQAAELRLRAERKAGGLLSRFKLRGGDRRSKGYQASLKLRDMGITRDQSKRWQKIASVANEDFERYVKASYDLGTELTAAGAIRLAVSKRKSNGEVNPATRRSPLAKCAGHEEIIAEMTNHCQLLTDILRPIYEGEAMELQRGERRVTGRLLREMQMLIGQLQKKLTTLQP